MCAVCDALMWAVLWLADIDSANRVQKFSLGFSCKQIATLWYQSHVLMTCTHDGSELARVVQGQTVTPPKILSDTHVHTHAHCQKADSFA